MPTNPQLQRLEIEDTSDCETCQKRNAESLAMLTTVRCKVLENCQCQECGREFALFVEELAHAD